MKDHASQQEAILGVALAQGHFGPGGLMALTIAQAQQASDLVSFRSSATPEEAWALTGTLAGSVPRQARALEQRATVAGPGALALGTHARQQWQAGMSYTVGWMRHAEQQLTGSVTSYAQALQRAAVRSAIITAGAALVALVLVLLATLIIARSIARPLRPLRQPEVAALDAAGAQPPAEVSVSAISTSFLRRSHSLLERLLRLIDSSELTEDDPERLASLFQMDHLATRMRRNTESALVIAGHDTPHHLTEPVTLVDVLRAAVSEVEEYDRVALDVQQGVSVSGSAAADTVHLLAELLENATTFSPGTTQVIVSGHTAREGGSLIKITNSGPGIDEEQLSQLNWQLAHPRLPDTAVGQRMGFLAVAHLAARHGITVTLGTPPDGGTSAEIYLPAPLMSPEVNLPAWMGPPGEALRSGAGARTSVPDEDLLCSAPRFAAGPEQSVPEQSVPEQSVPEHSPERLAARDR
jgi:signal transduction histidine kinase